MKLTFSNIFKGDRGIWMIIFFLFIYSMMSVYSASGQLAFRDGDGSTTAYLIRQAFMLILSISVIVVIHHIPYKYFSRASVYLWYLSIGLLVFTLFFGMNVNDARRWIMLPGGITFQTSDFAKVALLMYLSRVLALKEEEINSWKGCFQRIFLPVAITTGLILPANLSTAVLIFGVSMILVFFSNLKFKYFAGMIGVVMIFGVLFIGAVKTFKDVGRFATWNSRIEGFTSGDKEENIQEKHAKIAVATGGLFGKGPGKSNQRNILPHPYSDYIFAVIVEEYGLILGAIPLILLYMFLFLRVKIIVKKANRKFGVYVVSGLATMIVLQAFSNMAVTTNIIPVTGQPLPFVSYGGTSIVFIGMALGVILSVSREITDAEKQKQLEAEAAAKAEEEAQAAIKAAEAEANTSENADVEEIEEIDNSVLEESLDIIINDKNNEDEKQ
jgi:cell division protein FtsW